MSDSAKRQREFKDRMRAKGFQQVTVWVPAAQASELFECARVLCEQPGLMIGPFRDARTRRMVSIPK